MISEPVDRKPRLGDRKDLRIEIQPSAVSSYRQTRRETTGVNLTDAEAREELEDVLRNSSVTYSSGEDMSARGRVRRLEVDVQSDLVRVRPDLVRCSLAQVRKLDTRIERNGSRERGSNRSARDVYDAPTPPKRKIGVLVARPDGRVEYRMVAEDNGAPAPPWVPVPEHVRMLALRDDGLRAWLAKYGEVLPKHGTGEVRPSKPSGENIQNWQRSTEQILLRVKPEDASMIRDGAKEAELSLADYVVRLVRLDRQIR